MPAMKFGIGQPVRRVADRRFITGHGFYTAAVEPRGTLTAVFLRSRHVHAKFTIGDRAAAKALPGV